MEVIEEHFDERVRINFFSGRIFEIQRKYNYLLEDNNRLPES